MLMSVSFNPKSQGYRMPAEFDEHSSSWLLWPERNDIWRMGAKPVQAIFAKIANTIAEYEPVTVGVCQSQYENARNKLSDKVRVVEISFDDAWVRDTGATFIVDSHGKLAGVDWHFNAWGGIGGTVQGKWNLTGSYYPWKLDDMVARKIIEIEKAVRFRCPLITEGGALHSDGKGSILAIKECLQSRNEDFTISEIEELLITYLGADRIVWIEQGLYLEENNGHIDNMCCFVDSDTILLHWCEDTSDPQYEISAAAYETLTNTLSSNGKKYEVIKVPQPGVLTITEEEHEGVDESEYAIPRPVGERLPASYINSYICNGAVIVPSFSSKFDSTVTQYDDNALEIYKKAFPKHTVIQIPARELLLGGGGIHCIIQQVPKNSN
jgi:agmatine deiminase